MANILILDDDITSRRAIALLLQQRNHRVYEAAHGYEGMRVVAKQPLALAIVDLMMPEKDGIETIIELRRADAAIGIIAISGGGDLGIGKDMLGIAARLGADRVFQKPIKGSELIAAVEELLLRARNLPQDARTKAVSGA